MYKKYKRQDPMEFEWVQAYYNYMRRYNETVKYQQKVMRYNREDEYLEFCESEDMEKPVMLYKYKELGQEFITVFYINDDNSVNELTGYNKYAEVECLFDVENRKFSYYIHEINGNQDKYTKLSEAILVDSYNKKVDLIDIEERTYKDVTSYTFNKDEKDSVTTLDGIVIEITKFDQKFIKTNMVEMNWSNLNLNTYEDGIRKDFSVAVNNMIHNLTKEEQSLITEKEKEINNKKQQMKNAIEEIEKARKAEEERQRQIEEAMRQAEEERQRQEEEARKKAEEEARNRQINEQQQTQTIQVQQSQNIGNYTLKYGTNKGKDYGTVGDPFSEYEIAILLNEDGTYTEVDLITIAGVTQTYSGTYTIIQDTNIGPVIKFSVTDTSYQITGNNQFTSLSGSGEIIKLQE